MDVKSLLLGTEDSLPTLEQNLSTSTAAHQPELPTITANASTYWKIGGSTIMGVVGFLYIGYGRKTNDVQKIVIGVLLTLGSFFIF